MGFPFAALASFAGGILKRRDARRADANNRPAAQVKQYEEAGINPLFGMTSGSYVPYSGASIGDAFAVAGSQYQRHTEFEHEQKLKETALAQENKSLKKQLDKVAKPQEKSHLGKYGDILPLPSESDLNAGSKGSGKSVPVVGIRAGGPESSTERALTVVTPYGSVQSDPNWTPYQQFEDEYGDLAGLAYSGIRLADLTADIVHQKVLRPSLVSISRSATKRKMRKIYRDVEEAKKQAKFSKRWGNSPPRNISPTRAELDRARYLRHSLGG